MGRPTRFQVLQYAKPMIIDFFTYSPLRVYSESGLSKVLAENKEPWRLSAITSTEDFINFLLEKNIMDEIKIESKKYKSLSKYVFGQISPFEIALSLSKNSYLCHYSAVFLHNLTENVPKTIYTNFEQIPRNTMDNRSNLIQENIDKAFARPMRQTNNIYTFNENTVYLLNGKNVNQQGVVELELEGRKLPVTSIERTLIDITVRPNYAGGVQEVLSAFIAAKRKFSVNRLVSLLKKMDFIYPYHQALGFYLEKAGYDSSRFRFGKPD